MKYENTRVLYVLIDLQMYKNRNKIGMEMKKRKIKDSSYLSKREGNVIGKDYTGDFKCNYNT